MADLATYIPESVTCLIAGLLPVEGFVDGTFIQIQKNTDPYAAVRTPDGTVARMYNQDSTYTVTLTLYSGSSSHDVMTKLWQLDELTQMGKFPLLIRDGSGSDLFFSATTWVEGVPDLTKSNGYDPRVWVLRSSQAAINFGGNQSPSSLIQDIANIAVGALPSIGGMF